MLQNNEMFDHPAWFILQVSNYTVTNMGQKKELLAPAHNGLRNPCNPFAALRLGTLRPKAFGVLSPDVETPTPLTGTPADVRAQQALSKTLGLANGERRFYVRLEYSL